MKEVSGKPEGISEGMSGVYAHDQGPVAFLCEPQPGGC